jgi:hypothetical protein
MVINTVKDSTGCLAGSPKFEVTPLIYGLATQQSMKKKEPGNKSTADTNLYSVHRTKQ